MAESLNRKACDRCHAQKLSCKRIGDGICDRCLRLKAECKSSPSLRYKKQIQHYDQTQEQQQQQQQQQQQHHHQQQPEKPQLLMQHHQPRELQRPQQQPPPPRLDYSQGQSAMAQITLNHETHQHIEARDSTERRSPKRRRTGSEAHLVQRDAGLPQLANDATTNPGLQGHLMAVPNPAMGLAEYAINLRNMDYMAGLAQPSMPPHHLLGSQIPSRVDDCFTLHQVIPSLWPNQSHEEAQQLQQHHHQLGPHHHLHHHQQQQVFDQVSVAPLVVPDPAASQQQQIFSSVPQEQHQYQHQQQQLFHQQRATTTLLGCRRRQGAPPPALTHATASSVIDRRPRSNKVRINYTDFAAPKQDNLSGPYIMDQFFQIYARVRVLSNHLERLEQGIDYSDGPDGQPNEFTVAELYKHTHEVVDILERAVAVKNAPRTTATAAAAAPDCPLDATDAANGMFTVSLYARLLDLLQRLFAHVRARLARADPKRDDTFPSWLLPEMNIGAASIGAHPAFHMSLTVQLAMQFLSRFREVTVVLGLVDAALTNGRGAHGASALPRGSPGGGDDAVSLSMGDIKNREGMLSKTLGQLQDELNTFMDTMDAIDAMEEDEDKK